MAADAIPNPNLTAPLDRIQRTGSSDATVIPIDSSEGLALSTIRRRLSTVAAARAPACRLTRAGGFYSHLCALGELDHNPVQRGVPVRSPVTRDRRVIASLRPVRHLPRILDHDDVIKLVAALCKDRDRAMIDAMLLAGLRRCEVLGPRLADIRWGERRLFIADGKGGHQRIVPISPRFFDTLGDRCVDLIDEHTSQLLRHGHEPDVAGVRAELEEDKRSRGVRIQSVRHADTDDSVALCHPRDIHARVSRCRGSTGVRSLEGRCSIRHHPAARREDGSLGQHEPPFSMFAIEFDALS